MTNTESRKTYAVIDSPQNKRLIATLRKNGEDVLIFPPLTASRAEIGEEALEFIKNPSGFEWIILTDVFAADFFVEAMREAETDFFELDEVTVCALGEAVADRLRFEQIHSDVIPPKFTDETVFSMISQYAAGHLNEVRFLVLREKTKRFGFIEALRREHAAIEELTIYEAAFANEPELTKLKTLLKGGAIDDFIFSSAEDVAALKMLLAVNDLADILSETKVFATTEIAYQTLQENGLRPLYFHHQ